MHYNKTNRTLCTRLTAALLSIPLLCGTLSMTSCSKKEAVKEKPTNVYRTEILFETSYSDYDNASHAEFHSVKGIGERIILCGYQYDEEWNQTELFFDIDTETGAQTAVNIPPVSSEDGEYRNFITFADDGTAWYTVNAGSYDEETETYHESFLLYHTDSDGQILAMADLYELFGDMDDQTYLYLNHLQPVGDTVFLAMEDGIYTVDPEMTALKEVKLSDLSYVNTLIPCDGGIYASYFTASDYTQRFVHIDAATLTVGAPMDIPSRISNYLSDAMESETYDVVYKTSVGLCGYDIASDTETELLNWVNSDLNPANLSDTYITPSGVVYALLNKYENDTRTVQLLKMTRIPDEEIVEKYMLTFGCIYIDYDILDAIVDFNRTNDEYRITVLDYSAYNAEENEWTGGVTQFSNDIIAGKIPDIIQISEDMPMDSYASKGLFADLRPFMENDPVFASDDLYENILDAFSVNGMLYRIAPSFTVRTLAAKSSLAGENDGWTMDEMNAAINKIEPGSDPFGGEVTRMEFLGALCASVKDQFIDPKTGACSFSSPEFIKILEFAKTLPEQNIWDTTNWDEVGEDFYLDMETRYRDSRTLLYHLYLGNYTTFWEVQQGMFGEPVSLVGYPNENRQGATIYPSTVFAISSQSLCQEGAWAFLSEYFAERKAQDSGNQYEFSIFRSVNRKLAEQALAYHDNYWYEQHLENSNGAFEGTAVMPDTANEEGSKKTWTFWIGNQQIDIGMMTEEAVARVDSFLESLSQCYQYDKAMMNIIMEEASAFFAGQKTAEEVAGLIQSRVSIYAAESR